jgi:hypothetical protein
MFEKINQNLFLRAVVISIAVLASSSVYIFGYLQKVPGSSYSGIRSMNASDFNVNAAWVKQAQDGNVIFQNPFTSVHQKPFLIRPFYVAISLPFHLFKLDPSTILHIWRIILSTVLLISLFRLIQIFDQNPSRITIAFLLIAFTSGIGYFLRKIVPASADFQIPEAFLFLTLGEVPHFQYSILLLWSGVAGIFVYSKSDRSGLWIFLICLGLLWWDHPFDALSLIAIGTFAALSLNGWRKKVFFFIVVALISIPPVIYFMALSKLPYAQGAAEQNLMPSPKFVSLLPAFLPLILLAILGAIDQLRIPERRNVVIFLIGWSILHFAMAYLPVAFQRRLLSGVQFPLSILAAFGLQQKIKKPIFIGVILIFLACTNFYIIKTQIDELKSRTMPFYLPAQYESAFQWLSNQPKGPVLSAFITANFIPANTGMPAYWGHSALSPNISGKHLAVKNFYESPNSDFIHANNIRYIFVGWEERQYSTPELLPPFSCIYNRDRLRIYELK